MSYVDDHLLPGERVVHRTRPHWIIFAWPILLAVLSLSVLILFDHLGPYRRYWFVGLVPAAFAVLLVVAPMLRYTSSEYAVTDRRVLIKLGLIQRRSLETLLSKIEAIGVDQSLMGRLCDFGTITITGTGGTHESFELIDDPLEFRRQVQAQIVARDDDRAGSERRPASGGRVERECPYCAERILARARLCRFCGRDVTPAA